MMTYVVEPTKMSNVHSAYDDCQWTYSWGPGTSDPDCVGLCLAADDP